MCKDTLSTSTRRHNKLEIFKGQQDGVFLNLQTSTTLVHTVVMIDPHTHTLRRCFQDHMTNVYSNSTVYKDNNNSAQVKKPPPPQRCVV